MRFSDWRSDGGSSDLWARRLPACALRSSTAASGRSEPGPTSPISSSVISRSLPTCSVERNPCLRRGGGLLFVKPEAKLRFHSARWNGQRTDETRDGKESVRTDHYRWSPRHTNK